eukprot:89656_1
MIFQWNLLITICVLPNALNLSEYTHTDSNYFIQEWIISDNTLSAKGARRIAGNQYYSDIITIIGGQKNDSNTMFRITKYNMSSGLSVTWSYRGWAVANDGNGFATLHDNIYFYNFYGGDGNMNNNFFIYNMNNYTMSQLGLKYPKPYETGGECYATDSKRYIFLLGGGGGDDDNLFATGFQIFDTKSNKWSSGPMLTTPPKTEFYTFSQACTYNPTTSQIFVFSYFFHYDNTETSNINYYSVPNSTKWSVIGNNPLIGNVTRYLVSFMVSGSNTIFILDDAHFCNVLFVDTKSVYLCPLRKIPICCYCGIYVHSAKVYYSFGGFIDGDYNNLADTDIIQYALIDSRIQLNLSASTTNIESLSDKIPILLPISWGYDVSYPEQYNFTLKVLEYNSNNLVLGALDECFVCDDIEHCTNCSTGLTLKPHIYYVYENNINLLLIHFTAENQSDNMYIATNFSVKIKHFYFLNFSLSDTTISPGDNVPIKIGYFGVKSQSYYQFSLFSSNEAFKLDDILNIKTNSQGIESCLVGSKDNPITIPCDKGISPIINYNYITDKNNSFHLSILPLSNNTKNITTYPSLGINVKVSTCKPGYGMKNPNIAICELCPYNEFTLTGGIKPCHHCKQNLKGVDCVGGSDVLVSYNYWLSALNSGEKLMYPFMNIKWNDSMFSAFCPPGFCCTRKGGCNYLDEYTTNKTTSLCTTGRNLTTPLCGECEAGLSELFGSTRCGICNNTNWTFLILFMVFVIIPFVMYISYFESAIVVKDDAKNDIENKWTQESNLFKSLLFDVAIYYFQALSIIFSSKGITVSSWFQTIVLTMFNLQPSNVGGFSGFCIIPSLNAFDKLLTNFLLFPVFVAPVAVIIFVIHLFKQITLKDILCCCGTCQNCKCSST